MKSKQSGNSLIGVLVAVVIVIVAVLVFAFGGIPGQTKSNRADGKGSTLVGRSILKGQDTKCQTYLGQVRQSIQINTDPVDGFKPQTLQDLNLGSQFYACPIGGEAYDYDPETGDVHCPHPGHEKY